MTNGTEKIEVGDQKRKVIQRSQEEYLRNVFFFKF